MTRENASCSNPVLCPRYVGFRAIRALILAAIGKAALPTEPAAGSTFRSQPLDRPRGATQLESDGLLCRLRGGKRAVCHAPTRKRGGGLSEAFELHRARVVDVWEALQSVQPGIAAAAALRRSDAALAAIESVARRFASRQGQREEAIGDVAAFFDALGEASANPVFVLLNEPLLRLLKPSLAVIIDRVPQARSRIESAQSEVVAAVRARDAGRASDWMARHVRDFRRGYEVAGIPLSTEVGEALDADAPGVS